MRKFSQLSRIEQDMLWLFAVVLAIGIPAGYYFVQTGLNVSDTDATANLNISRFVLDGLTPGVSQIGVWNMFPHVLLAPATRVDYWYRSGFAGFITYLPFLYLAAYFIHEITYIASRHRGVSRFVTLLFLLNPYVLYYASAPMSEIPFLVFMLGSVYWFYRWTTSEELSHVLFSALYISLASFTRFEGFALVPALFVMAAVTMFVRRHTWIRVLAELLMISIISSIGWVLVVLYSWLYTGSPTYFIFYSTAERPALSAQGAGVSKFFEKWPQVTEIQYLATGEMMSHTLVVIGLCLLPLIPFFAPAKEKVRATWVALFSMVPTIFLWFVLAFNVRSIVMPPYGIATNMRYALYFIVPIWFSISVLLGYVVRWNRKILKRIVIGIACTALTAIVVFHSVDNFFIRQFPSIRNNFAFVNPNRSLPFVVKMYDYGYVLATHPGNTVLFLDSYIPPSNIIYESNYRYFIQARREPWLFARWVIRNKLSGDFDSSYSSMIIIDETFLHYYELVGTNFSYDVYKLRDPLVRATAKELGYDPDLIPSLNPRATWDPPTFYQTLGSARQ